MGRSGGGGGGGHSSGGFSSGGRSSGSFSGGHSSTSFGGGRSRSHSSFGSYSGSSSSGHYTNYGRGRSTLSPIIFFNNSIGQSNSGNYSSSASNKSTKYFGLISSVIIFIVTAIICIPMIYYSLSSIVVTNTVDREPLPTSYAIGTDFYTDEDGDWIYNSSKLTKGMRDFYDNTGVWPYVYILPNGYTTNTDRLQEMAEVKYEELFEDEAHFIMVFCDDDKGGYNWGYCVGADAKTIMDQEALVTMNNFLERNYDNLNISEEEIFSNTFKSTSERIMGISSGSDISVYVLLIAGCLIMIVAILNVVYQINSVRKKNKLEEEKQKEEKLNEILSKPLDKFSDNELDEIASKYEDAPSSSTV